MTYLARLGEELARVGIGGRLRDRILAEAADHLAEGEVARFGDSAELARLFADELATARTRRAAFAGFAALAAAGTGFAAAWLLTTPAGGWPDIFSAEWAPLGAFAAFGMLLCPQAALVAGSLALLQAVRRRGARLPAAELELLLRRTRVALGFGLLTLGAIALYAIEFRAQLASWYSLWVPVGAGVLAAPLAAASLLAQRAAVVRSSVPGGAGGVFDDLPVKLPRRPWLLCALAAVVVGVLALVAGGGDEGPRNAVLEIVLLVACFVALGRGWASADSIGGSADDRP
jgi:hypothetical protein